MGQEKPFHMIRAARRADAEAIAGLWNKMIAETTDTFTTVPKTVAGISALIAERPVIVAEFLFRYFA